MEFECDTVHDYFPKLTLHHDCGIYMVETLIYYLFFDNTKKKVLIYLLISVPTKLVNLVEESQPTSFKLWYKAIKCLTLPMEVKWMT